MPGNHDIGCVFIFASSCSYLSFLYSLGDSKSFSPSARTRYKSHFGPLNSHTSIANHTVILLDAMGLVEEDYQRHSRGQSYAQWKPMPGGTVEFAASFAKGQGFISLALDFFMYCISEESKQPVTLVR